MPEPDPELRAAEAAMLDGADCGGTAWMGLSQAAVQVLVDVLSGLEPPTDMPPTKAGLNIRAMLPKESRWQ